MDSPSRKAWRIQEWRSSGLQQQVLEEERRRNTAVRAELASFPVQDGRTANLWTGTFSCDFWSQFAEMRVSTVQIGKEQGGGEQPLVAEPASLLLTFTDTPPVL